MDPQSPWTDRYSPTLEDFEIIARAAFETLPDGFRGLCDDIQISIAEYAEKEVLQSLGLASPYDLLGLFQGVGMAQGASEVQTGQMPNRIWLYRRAILDYWVDREETLGAIIRHVLIHEIGHHFGLSDADMEAIEAEAD